MTEPATFRIRNWGRYQHYKDRNPPWIKLHFELLSSRDWVTLADASRVLAVVCMLIASRNEGEVPNDPEYIKRVGYLNKDPDFKPLIQCGFLEVASTMQADASTMQASARPETETETETEAEAEAEAQASGGRISWSDLKREWNDRTEDFSVSPIRSWPESRKDHYRARRKEHGPDFFGRLLDEVEASEFLRGEVAPREGKRHPFRLNIDWALSPANCTKILEQMYNDKAKGGHSRRRRFNPMTGEDEEV